MSILIPCAKKGSSAIGRVWISPLTDFEATPEQNRGIDIGSSPIGHEGLHTLSARPR